MGNKGSDRENNAGCLSMLFLVLFYPLSALILYYRAKNDRSLMVSIGKRLKGVTKYFGAYCVVVAFIQTFRGDGSLVDKISAFLIALVIYGLMFGLVYHKGKGLISLSERIKTYLDLIVNQHVFSIPQIAAKMNLPEAKVIMELKDMVQRGFLRETQIDEARKVIIVPAVEAQMRFQEELDKEQRLAPSITPAAVPGSTPPPPMAPPRPEVARPQMRACKCCGANNLVWPNREPLCEFCGSIV